MSAQCDAVIFYDGVCAMCNGVVRFILPRDPDGQFCFVALQSDTSRRLLERHGHTPGVLDTMYLMIGYQTGEERVLANSSAVLETLRRLGGIWTIVSWLRIVPSPIRDFAYGLIVKNRYRIFGKYDSCPLAPPQWRGRFIQEEE